MVWNGVFGAIPKAIVKTHLAYIQGSKYNMPTVVENGLTPELVFCKLDRMLRVSGESDVVICLPGVIHPVFYDIPTHPPKPPKRNARSCTMRRGSSISAFLVAMHAWM